jgi:cell division protease FtsH
MVYKIARDMVTTYNFGENNFDYKNLSTDAAIIVDREIDTIVSKCYDMTLSKLKHNRDKLEQLKNQLLEEEIVDGTWVYDLMGVQTCNEIDCYVNFD